jgi:hypothetical protein
MKLQYENYSFQNFGNVGFFWFFFYVDVPKTITSQSQTPPLSLSYTFSPNIQQVAIRLQASYTQAKIEGHLPDNRVDLDMTSTRLVLAPTVLVYPMRLRSTDVQKVRFYVAGGAGLRLTQNIYKVTYRNKTHEEDVKLGFPFAFKLGVGLNYYPIPKLALGFDLATGMSNCELSLRYVL